MITNRTVLILGAGASHPYGFPTGKELRNEIILGCAGGRTPPLANSLLECGFIESQIIQFGNVLRLSGQVSVDRFLERRKEYLEIGKAALAISLVTKEDLQRLFQIGASSHWY